MKSKGAISQDRADKGFLLGEWSVGQSDELKNGQTF